ncbi:anti-sigma factor [Burkholderia thailandensis]|uniref:Anti-sigma-K factor rskA family protein n=1 Tax=Burkholderia thailandensis TaxID=57975 RepID=A0AAW9CZS1_BURTH|nr:anti-sigma factor [Burkholderia thailandensis]AHI65368.1 anti-sigma-K factor rskA family protein [Burkholderia thailandensis H0587]AOJ50915.1 anti-sigma factor [Burkholderia thailandensis]AVR26342.1 anti-sigma factor [Burkholderia thailandensis]MCS3393560.1 anti-sigma factor [Burkholderia thailandensis]MCS6426678.1 anti-sigma factor [Burkholderia thailandensis]
MNTPADHDPELRCAEYALGVLDADARRELEQSAARDPALQAMLERWQRRLAPLADDVTPVAPPARIWTRIQRDLGFVPPQRPRSTAPAGGWWNSVRLWRWVGIGASAAALGLLAVNVIRVDEAPPRPVAEGSNYMAATLARPDGVAQWTATVDLRRARMVVVPANTPPVAADRSTELWLIPPNAKPISLGVFASNAPASMPLPQAIVAQLDARAVLAVSLEPHGGSPNGQPTGPVLASGAMHIA